MQRCAKVSGIGGRAADLDLRRHLRLAVPAYAVFVHARVRAPVAADRAFPILKIVMRAGIAADADVLPILVPHKVVLGMLHDHQSLVGNVVRICGIRIGEKGLVLGPCPSGLVIAAQSERRALGQIVRQVLALDEHLHAAVQRCADTQDQLAALHIDGVELSIGVHAAALNGHVLPHGQLAALHLYGGVSIT